MLRGGSKLNSKFKFKFSSSVSLWLWALIYSARAKSTNTNFRTHEYPTEITVSLVGWPGLRDRSVEVTGQHHRMVVPAYPWEINSETARDIVVEEVDYSGWEPGAYFGDPDANGTVLTTRQEFTYKDFVLFPHKTILAE